VTGVGDGVRLAELVAALDAVCDASPAAVYDVLADLSTHVEWAGVVEARRPEFVEFRTEAVVVWRTGKRTEARYEHRYEIAPDGMGSHVVYRLRQTDITNAPLRMRLPLMRTMTHRLMLPLLCRRGFANLLRSADLQVDHVRS
jgi:hypothetical protein